MQHRTAATAILLVAMGLGSTPAISQGNWNDGRPIYESDVQRERDLREQQRAQMRKSYSISYTPYMSGGARPDISPSAPPIVQLAKAERPGTVIVDTGGRHLYYVLQGNQAYAYPISVGRQGFTWTGTERISRVVSWPTWSPPPEMRQRQPGLPITVSGGVRNPLGAKALYLGNTLYRIHGTNDPKSIGRASSSGCFRMMNEHVTHLASVARIGTTVRVVSAYNGLASEQTTTLGWPF